MKFEIRLFPETGLSYTETVTIDPEVLGDYETLIEYVQEVHVPQFAWNFAN